MPDDSGQLLGYYDPSHMPPAATFNLTVKLFDRLIVGVGADTRLPESHSKILIAVFTTGFMTAAPPTIGTTRDQAAVAGKLLVGWKTSNLSNLGEDTPPIDQPDSGNGLNKFQIATEGLLLSYLLLQLVDMALQLKNLVDQQPDLYISYPGQLGL